MTINCPYCQGKGRVQSEREKRNAEWALLRSQGVSISEIARRSGFDRATIKAATEPAYAAHRRDQMRFRYYLNNVLPRELDAEAAT